MHKIHLFYVLPSLEKEWYDCQEGFLVSVYCIIYLTSTSISISIYTVIKQRENHCLAGEKMGLLGCVCRSC